MIPNLKCEPEKLRVGKDFRVHFIKPPSSNNAESPLWYLFIGMSKICNSCFIVPKLRNHDYGLRYNLNSSQSSIKTVLFSDIIIHMFRRPAKKLRK